MQQFCPRRFSRATKKTLASGIPLQPSLRVHQHNPASLQASNFTAKYLQVCPPLHEVERIVALTDVVDVATYRPMTRFSSPAMRALVSSICMAAGPLVTMGGREY